MQRAVSLKITLAVVLAAALIGGLAGTVIAFGLGGKSGTSEVPPEVAALTGGGISVQQLYRRDSPGVVAITSTRAKRVAPTFSTPAANKRLSALGSGFVIDKRGDILTNDHVVRAGTPIRVGFSSGVSYAARTVGADASTDIAVVRVSAPPSALDPLHFDNSSTLAVGDPVYAIGDPLGLDRTMTSGIVSASGRDIAASDGLTIPNAIQTDAPINRGNSGGPLLDGNGRVIGINAQIETNTGGNVGIGFAIPSNTARTVANELVRSGRASHAWLGVVGVTIDPGVAAHMHGVPRHGVAIVSVLNGSPAAKAGLEGATHAATVGGESVPVGGDAIVAVDGKGVSTSEQLANVVVAHRPGDRLRLTLVRGGRQRTVGVTLRLGANAGS